LNLSRGGRALTEKNHQGKKEKEASGKSYHMSRVEAFQTEGRQGIPLMPEDHKKID
jgi:hypothetical protein